MPCFLQGSDYISQYVSFFGGVVTLFVFACYSVTIFHVVSQFSIGDGAKFKKDLKPAPRFELSRFTSKYVAGHGVIMFYYVLLQYVLLWSLFRCWWYFNFMIVYSCVIFWSVGTWSQLFFSKVKHNFCLTSFCPGGASQCSDLSRSWRNRTWALGRVQISLWQRSTWEVVGMEFL